jgi:hypothetical protein
LVLALVAGAFGLGHYTASHSRTSLGRFSPDASPRYEIPRPEGPASSWAEVVEVLSERDGYRRVERLAELLARLDDEAALQASAALESRALDLTGPEIELLLRAYARHDAAAAANWAAYDSPLAYRPAAVATAIQLLAEQDPLAASQLVQAISLIRSETAEIGEIALIRGWYYGGAEGLDEYIQYLGAGYSQQRALSERARQLIKQEGPEVAMAWARAVPGEGEDKRFVRAVNRQLGSQLAQLDVPFAVAWCDEVCDEDLGRDVMALIAQRWAAQDGPAAMEWLSTRSAGKQRDLAVKGAFRGWWRQDSEGFRAWADPQLADRVPRWLAPLLENYAGAVGRKQPLEGIDIAMKIDDEQIRNRSLSATVVAWLKKDDASANEWLDRSPLGDDIRARIASAIAARAAAGGVPAESAAADDGEAAADDEDAAAAP